MSREKGRMDDAPQRKEWGRRYKLPKSPATCCQEQHQRTIDDTPRHYKSASQYLSGAILRAKMKTKQGSQTATDILIL